MKNTLEFIRKLPKADLHVHLDGSVRIDTMIDISKRDNLKLPSYTETGLNELVFKTQYRDLNEYLTGFSLALPTMQTPEDLERIGYEFAKDNIADGVCYVEVRFAPHLHINENQNIDEVLLSVDRGLAKAKKEHKQSPEFNYGIIVCAMRYFTKGFAKYLDEFIDNHQNLKAAELFSLSSYELVKECVRIRDQYNLPIVALDIAGAEAGNPPIYHKKAYDFAHRNFMHLTVHAGEETGPDNIFEAIAELYPERIGHGFYLFDEKKIEDPSIKNKKDFVEKLVNYIANTRITIEVCLTSNLQTNPKLNELKNHAIGKKLADGLSVSICTDNRTVSKTTMTNELILAAENFNLTQEQLEKLVLNSFEKSFFPGTYKEKLAYIRACFSA